MSELADLAPGQVVTWEPTENAEVEAHDLADGSARPPLFKVTVRTDAGHLAGIYTLRQVAATEQRFYVVPVEASNARRVHDEAVRAIEESGGEVVDDKTEVPA